MVIQNITINGVIKPFTLHFQRRYLFEIGFQEVQVVINIKMKLSIEVLSFIKIIILENDTSNEKLSKKNTDETKIKETLELLDGLKVQKIKSKNVLAKMNSNDTYMFAFLKIKNLSSGKVPYAFYILNDGTIIFTHKDVDSLLETPLMTTETHKDILEKMKENLNIVF